MSTTHFGFKSVDEADKSRHVKGVFDSVAPQYDVMNDLMSLGLHRFWKAYAVMLAQVHEGDQVLDIAGGTGDMALALAKKTGRGGQVVHTDINEAMLGIGRNRLIDAGFLLPTWLKCIGFLNPGVDCCCWSFPESLGHWRQFMIGIRSRYCPN